MSNHRTILFIAATAAIIAGVPALLAAQQQPPADPAMQAAEAALAACAAAAGDRQFGEAQAIAQRAENAFRARIARRPDDVRALVGLARTLGACRIPGAEPLQRGELSAESIDLLRRVLEVAPEHWAARYTLALNYYQAPSFMRRTGDAARELDQLIAQQGERTNVPEFARPFEYRGMIWMRSGQPDSAAAVWQRGVRLFPADSALRMRLESAGSGALDTHVPAPSPRAQSAPATTIDTVRVSVSRAAIAGANPAPSRHVVSRAAVLTTAGGMADVLQAVQMQPGATRVGDGADLFARGGDPSETATLIEGGRIVPMTRFEGLSGGLFGVLDPFVVRSARFSTGGFSVRHGNALSGLLEVQTDGRPRESQWRAGLGLSQGGATARTPLTSRSGIWGTVRATHVGALLRTHGRQEEFRGAPHSVDGMASYIVNPSANTELRVIGLLSHDASARIVDANGFSGPFDSRGSARAVIVSSQHIASSRPLVVNGTLSLSDRSTDWAFGALARDRNERGAIARTDVEYAPNGGVTIRAGLETGRFSRAEAGALPLTPSVAPGDPVRLLATDSSSWSGGGYAESEFRMGVLNVLAGARVDRLPGERELTVDPRLSVGARHDSWVMRFSSGIFHQGRWRPDASIPDAGSPGGLPREARHLIASVEREGAVSIRAEGFLKRYADYREHGAGPQIVDGRTRGVDVLIRRSAGERITGWLGYSLLDAEVQLADGQRARAPFDVRHTATGNGTFRIARATTLGTTLRYGTGRPFTPITGAEGSADGRRLPLYGEPASERLPAYTRWDARLMQYIPLRRSLLAAYVEVLNMLDRENIAGYVWDAEYRTRRATNTFYSTRTVLLGLELQSR